jgi:Na+/melibiose symporter-like transporter
MFALSILCIHLFLFFFFSKKKNKQQRRRKKEKKEKRKKWAFVENKQNNETSSLSINSLASRTVLVVNSLAARFFVYCC